MILSQQISQHNTKLQTTLNDLHKLNKDKEQMVSRLLNKENNARSAYLPWNKGSNNMSNQIHEMKNAIVQQDDTKSNLKRETVQA
jgi:hypothetical protein